VGLRMANGKQRKKIKGKEGAQKRLKHSRNRMK
jgi:hypothetical protein